MRKRRNERHKTKRGRGGKAAIIGPRVGENSKKDVVKEKRKGVLKVGIPYKKNEK